MQNLPEGVSERDLCQWLNDGWCLVDGEVAQLEAINVGDEVVFITTGGNIIDVPWEDRSTDIYVHWPLCGSVNLPTRRLAVYLERQPLRQYRRTYNARALNLSIPDKWHVMATRGTAMIQGLRPGEGDVAEAAFNAEFPEWDEAVERLQDRTWGSVALNQHIILTYNHDRTFNVFYRGVRAGLINGIRFTPTGLLDGPRALKLLDGRVTL